MARMASPEKAIDARIRKVESDLARLDEKRHDLAAQLRALRRARQQLDGRSRVIEPQRIAGPKVIDGVRTLLRRGPMAQNEITRRLQVNSGSVAYAIRYLAEQGEIVDTGERGSRNSRVFNLAKQGRRTKARPSR